ncbi:MAG: phosphoglycerate dehydrogenase [Fretibacterium sp.]|nr:phosphoglycerate dehydrogenase [Fretibacterium sp.]
MSGSHENTHEAFPPQIGRKTTLQDGRHPTLWARNLKERKVLCLNPISPVGLARLREGYTLTEDAEGAAGILVRSADMREMTFPAELRAIARAGAGVNNIPLDRCADQGIVVFNTPGANANSVKELVIAGLLLASRDIIGGNEWVKAHITDADIAKDGEKAKKAFAGHEIKGRSLGVVGLGAVGVLVANAAIALGMEVYGYDPYLSVRSAWQLSPLVKQAENVESLYSVSDFVTLHVPAMDTTRGMVDTKAIGHMRDGVRVLNFARDVLVDEEAMGAALRSGKVSRYVSDFPNPLSAALENAIVLPHLGASTEEAEENCAVMAAEELQDYLDNGNITHSVNYPDLNAGVCETEARVAILHKNIPNMLSQITSFFGSNGLNIDNLSNKARGQYAYTLLDISHPMPSDTVERLREIGGVLRVRRVAENI